MLAIPAAFVLLTSMKTVAEGDDVTSSDIKLQDLTFSRKAVKLKGDKKKEFPLTQQGFLWDEGDSKTNKFRPQGITTVVEDERELVIVSWYGRSEANYENRGARISVVDVTKLSNNPSANNYKHILLVDKDKEPFFDEGYEEEKGTLHAGGIAYIDGKLHVADSRGVHRVIRVFDLNKIQFTSSKILKYDHILIEEYSYKSPVKPSFLSYDKDRKEILIGEFHKTPSDATGKQNLITWFKAPTNATKAATFNEKSVNIYRLPNKYKKMQGIVSMKDPADASKQIIWISTSYGSMNRSNLYKLQVAGAAALPSISAGTSSVTNPTMINPISSKAKKYPPGLEDLNISDSQQLWLLTEFRYQKGKYYALSVKNTKLAIPTEDTRRGVFAIPYNSGI